MGNSQVKLEEVEIVGNPLLEEVSDVDIAKLQKGIVLESIDDDKFLRNDIIKKFWSRNGKNFSDENRAMMDIYLNKVSLQTVQYLSAYKFKSVKKTRMLSVFLGWCGADHFYIGDIGVGLCKLFLGWVGLIFYFIDLFFIAKLARKNNYYDFMDIVMKDIYKNF